MGEAALQKSIIRAAEDRGAYVEKNHQGGYGRKGTPDLSLCYRGHWMSVEVKEPGAKTSRARREAQYARIQAIRAAGGIAFVTNSVGIVVDLLDQIDRLMAAPRADTPMGRRVIQPLTPAPHIVELAA